MFSYINISFFFFKFSNPNMTDLQMLGNSFCELAWYRRSKDSGPLFDPKVHLFENILPKMLDQLHWKNSISIIQSQNIYTQKKAYLRIINHINSELLMFLPKGSLGSFLMCSISLLNAGRMSSSSGGPRFVGLARRLRTLDSSKWGRK